MVTLSVPGYSQDQLKVSLEDVVLQIQGALNSENESDETVAGRKVHLRERHMNRFSRSMRLPAGIEGDKVGAKYDKGVLTLTIPKPEEVLPKQIEIAMSLSTLQTAPVDKRPRYILASCQPGFTLARSRL